MYCSAQKIEITDSAGSYPGTVLLGIDDPNGTRWLMEGEPEIDFASREQDSTPIDSDAVVVRGRGGKSQTWQFSHIKTDHTTVEVARRYLKTHGEAIPGVTVGARITYASDAADTPASGFGTARAHLQARGTLSGATETTFYYTLRWQIGA
tara:strand:- start:1381 stop:1833 length:453 start_codon:yes stop_codon:yes gene_type:complete